MVPRHVADSLTQQIDFYVSMFAYQHKITLADAWSIVFAYAEESMIKYVGESTQRDSQLPLMSPESN